MRRLDTILIPANQRGDGNEPLSQVAGATFLLGNNMRTRLLNADPLGRLYEPLHVLATRVRRAMGRLRKTIWADGSGRIFIENFDHAMSTTPRWIVGTYDAHAPVWLIEDDLRLALRVRASLWITDWEVVQPAVRQELVRLGSSKRPRGRQRKAAGAAIRVAPAQLSLSAGAPALGF